MAGHGDRRRSASPTPTRAPSPADRPAAATGGARGARGGAAGARRPPGPWAPAPGGSPEEPDPVRTCFERDRDRILHANAFRRLAGKTQVFVFPDDHQRTRLTHALEVAQVATAVARALRLNVALAEAIALGHDCGHGPGGHASEDALSPVRRRRATTTPSGAPTSCWRRSTCAPRRSTASATTPGAGRRRPRPRARSCRGPTASPTSATTSRTPSPPASSRPTCCRRWCASACGAPARPPARRVHRRR